jgi:hypothetical protein
MEGAVRIAYILVASEAFVLQLRALESIIKG